MVTETQPPASAVYLITGDDEAGMAARAAEIVQELTGPNPDPFSLEVLRERDDTKPAEVINRALSSLRTPAFLGGRKTVWIQNFSVFAKEGNANSTSAEGQALYRLAQLVREGIGDDMALVLNGPGIDQRKSLCKACAKQGTVITCNRPNVRDRDWQGKMMALIQDRALRKGITRPLSRGVVTHLVDCLGTDTGAVDSELEKLICYCGGPDQEITMEAARELCTGQGESVNWALGEALGDRRPQTALEIVDKLLYTAKDAESTARQLVGTVARHYRDLLQVRVFMQEHRFRDDRQVYAFLNQTPRPDLSDELAQGLEIVTGHPYRLRVLARQSRNYRGTELVDAVIRAADAYWLCISSAQSCRVVLEKLVLDLTAAVPTATRGRRTG